jgi:hypothetical protein
VFLLISMEDNSSMFVTCVELWQGAGSSPYEVLIEEGVYDYFLSKIENSFYDINNNPVSDSIYRGLCIPRDFYKLGDIIESKHPHSWSEEYQMASNFTGDDGIVLILSPKQPLKGLSICHFDNSFYNENEVILSALKLRVVEIDGKDFHVEVV